MKLHLHPDGDVFVRDDANQIVFQGTPDEVEEALGLKLSPKLSGVTEVQYDLKTKAIQAFGRTGQIDGVKMAFGDLAKDVSKLTKFRIKKNREKIEAEQAALNEATALAEVDQKGAEAFAAGLKTLTAIAFSDPSKDTIAALRADLQAVAKFLAMTHGVTKGD